MSYVDIALLAILALFSLMGFMAGFGKSVGKLFGWIMSILIVFIITDLIVNSLLSSKNIADFVIGSPDQKDFSLYKWIYNKLPQSLREISMLNIKEVYVLSGKEGIAKIIKEQGGNIISLFSPIIIKLLINPIYLSGNMLFLGEVISAQMALLIFSIIVGAILFLIVRIIMAIVSKVVRNAVGEEKGLLSRLGGLAVGGLRGIMYCAIFLVVIDLIIGANIKQFEGINNHVENSVIALEAIDVINKTTDKVMENNKGNDNAKKIIELVGYKNGSETEQKFWQEIIDLKEKGETSA